MTIIDNQVTGGMAVVAILVISGLGFALWRAALAAYRGIVATAKTGWKIFRNFQHNDLLKQNTTTKTTHSLI